MVSDGGVTPATGLRAKAGRLVQKVFPDLDDWQWNRKRDVEAAALVKERRYDERLADLGAPPPLGSTPRVVIVPKDGPSFDNWKVAGGNFFFEITQAAREYLGDTAVDLFSPEPGEDVADWHERLIRHVIDTDATHLMVMAETDPDGVGTWNWDILWSQLAPRWSGVMLGVVFDTAYRWISIPVRRIARMNDRFVLVDICMPMDGVMVKGRPEVGPVNMPVSNLTMEAIDARSADLPKIHDVSFLGSLYPQRVEMIEALRDRGVNVAVNPHHSSGEVLDLEGSRAHQPGYVDYMVGLAQSNLTINFGRSSAGDYFQLKTRVLEAELVGCVVLTDDVDRTERFWIPGEEYGYFATPSDVPDLVTSLLADREKLARMQEAGKRRAREINISSFWGGIEEGLQRRGLPSLFA